MYINQKSNLSSIIFLYFWSVFLLPGSVPDPFSQFTIPIRIRIRPNDPDPQHCILHIEAFPAVASSQSAQSLAYLSLSANS